MGYNFIILASAASIGIALGFAVNLVKQGQPVKESANLSAGETHATNQERWFIKAGGQIIVGEPFGSQLDCEIARRGNNDHAESVSQQEYARVRDLPPLSMHHLQMLAPMIMERMREIRANLDKVDYNLALAKSAYCDQ